MLTKKIATVAAAAALAAAASSAPARPTHDTETRSAESKAPTPRFGTDCAAWQCPNNHNRRMIHGR